MAILRRTERAMVRAMCGAKLMEKKRTEEFERRKTWKMQVEKESRSVGLKKEDALNRARWRMGIGEIAARVG